ncbi:MAG: SDR family NAD(P)-dependent oxidoreductase [Firmicutes bacterium]|nr:SDR family NAD(P)-dependent oxidoreductase [Bacillota bacterium]
MNKKIMIVTGGSAGLGLELVRLGLDEGYFVCNLGRNQSKMAALDAEFAGRDYRGFVGDVADEQFVAEAVAAASEIGQITFLFNNAQKSVFKAPTEFTSADIEESFDGVRAMLHCTKHVLLACGEEDVHIVNIMSTAALKGKKQESLYCAVKWGARGYTESLKATYADTSVKVTGVFPGGMNTGFWNEARDYISAEKSNTFMAPADVAAQIMDHVLGESWAEDLTIQRK